MCCVITWPSGSQMSCAVSYCATCLRPKFETDVVVLNSPPTYNKSIVIYMSIICLCLRSSENHLLELDKSNVETLPFNPLAASGMN